MPFLNVPRANIYYETSGTSGPWVTLINGHTRTLKDFKLMAKALIQEGFRVLSLDNRGSGDTTHEGSFTITDMADDVERLWDHETISASHVLGISMGGMIAQYLAAARPARLKKLVLVSTAASRRFIDDHAEKPWGTTLDDVKQKLAFYFAPAFLARNKLLVEAMAKQILKGIVDGEFAAAAAAQRQAMADFDGRHWLPRIEAPTLILHGAQDRVMSPQAAEELAQGLKHASLKHFDEAGHLLLAEAPKALYESVIDFLKS